MGNDLAALAADAYVYGFPLVFDLQMVGGKADMGMIAPAFHMFDYNLDHLGPGTIDDPAWKMPDRHASYLARRVAYHRDPAPAAPRHQQLAASPRRAVPAADAPVPAAAGHP